MQKANKVKTKASDGFSMNLCFLCCIAILIDENQWKIKNKNRTQIQKERLDLTKTNFALLYTLKKNRKWIYIM